MKLWERAMKRFIDVMISTNILVALFPVIVVICLAVRLDSPGPIIFKQRRLGKEGRIFRIYKFRTMFNKVPLFIDDTGKKMINRVDDDRLTRVGKFLRRTSLDELPQFLNVIRGDMSLVGPRPDLPGAMKYYDDYQRTRLKVQPGITGYAQILGRNDLDAAMKWNLDAEYAKNASIAFDLNIIFRTLVIVLSGRGVFSD